MAAVDDALRDKALELRERLALALRADGHQERKVRRDPPVAEVDRRDIVL